MFDNSFNGYFIYTHPVEFLRILVSLVILLLLIFTIPYFLFIFVDFFRSSLYKHEFYFLIKVIIFLISLFYFLNVFCFLNLFPLVWKFFKDMNNYSSNIFLELKLENYFYFLLEYTFIVNVFYLLIILIIIILSLNTVIVILENKKILLLLNILISTLISPPDILIQILLFFIFCLILEIFLFFYFFFHYFNMKKISV